MLTRPQSSHIAVISLFIGLLALAFSPDLLASTNSHAPLLDLTRHWVGYAALTVFILAYILVVAEDNIQLSKCKPVLMAAGIIWAMIATIYAMQADSAFHHTVAVMIRHNLLEYTELFLFLLVAMTYIHTMEERQVFNALRSALINHGLSLRSIFWLTGSLAFFISPIADNLTTALLMTTIIMAVGGSNHKFVVLACINIVVSANAGGAFSPFGDITTLMVWQKGLLEFQTFFHLLIPALVNWLVPAILISIAVPNGKPDVINEKITMKKGALVVVGLFLMTITITVLGHSLLHLPPALCMMTGFGFLGMYSYYLQLGDKKMIAPAPDKDSNKQAFNVFYQLGRVNWDTLMFFYGIILCVGGLGTIGYLAIVSQFMYEGLGATSANILVGILSALVDNIPIMFAVLAMMPNMDVGQWLLVTLTAGVGGSLLSVGSAAGVAVMGEARGIYTFFAHLKWTWAILLGYIASIWVHVWLNADLFSSPLFG